MIRFIYVSQATQLFWRAVQTPLTRRMATSSIIRLYASQQPVLYISGISGATARATSELLQENHDKHHVFFNNAGFHNHIAHHLLSLFALNATPAELRQGWEDNISYQRPLSPTNRLKVTDATYREHLGDSDYYTAYLTFFKTEIDQKSCEEVLNEYVFKADEQADDMLVRMFSGILHPIIHLGFGIEFEQPAIIAEALAQAAVHSPQEAAHLLESEAEARKHSAEGGSDRRIVHLLDDIFAEKGLGGTAKYARQVHVTANTLEEKTAEMINACAYFTGAAQQPPYEVKFDFFNIHALNLSIFFSSFLHQPWLSAATKIRLLEWKIRIDLSMYASPRPPQLHLHEITSYPNNASWGNIVARVKAYHDDGHACKLIRALANGERACKKYEHKEEFIIKGDMWRKLANMAIDSVEAGPPDYVRSQAWASVPLRNRPCKRVVRMYEDALEKVALLWGVPH
ncbi:hypothetical protein K491DRAFT_654172 [Lophiostoma macrostomum CBS 122681]|uniref:HypA-like protein n=1 Tax=Lophiostoma macrostomum CBS 122681 TaxID=1314788 RepID=A0A6A6TF22_9PLEO|nr:hypothetical protein K491DRAFT_654172 [Lophiostoma macrostomum CBS 122681]